MALLRISGPRSVEIAEGVFLASPPLRTRPRHVSHGHVVDRDGRTLDTALGWFLQAPSSYTGEDTIEITTHGSDALLDLVLDAFVHGGARLAEPGEFTRRAFLNGRMDLVQAEAVIELINAGSTKGLRAAYGVLAGGLTRSVQRLREQLTDALMRLEGGLDFVEDVAAAELGDVSASVAQVLVEGRRMLETFEGARRRRDGWKVAILGPPNVG